METTHATTNDLNADCFGQALQCQLVDRQDLAQDQGIVVVYPDAACKKPIASHFFIACVKGLGPSFCACYCVIVSTICKALSLQAPYLRVVKFFSDAITGFSGIHAMQKFCAKLLSGAWKERRMVCLFSKIMLGVAIIAEILFLYQIQLFFFIIGVFFGLIFEILSCVVFFRLFHGHSLLHSPSQVKAASTKAARLAIIENESVSSNDPEDQNIHDSKSCAASYFTCRIEDNRCDVWNGRILLMKCLRSVIMTIVYALFLSLTIGSLYTIPVVIDVLQVAIVIFVAMWVLMSLSLSLYKNSVRCVKQHIDNCYRQTFWNLINTKCQNCLKNVHVQLEMREDKEQLTPKISYRFHDFSSCLANKEH